MKKIIVEYDFVEYNELSGLSNSDVLTRLAEADLLIDQAYSDLPLSRVSMEAFVLGVPVLLSGYGLLDLKSISFGRVPNDHLSPITFSRQIRALINSPDGLEEIAERGKSFVETVWSKEGVSRKNITILTGNHVPLDWWHDPTTHLYLQGYGLKKKKLKRS